MTPPDRLTPRRRRAPDRRRHVIRPLVESLEQRLQLSLVAATPAVTLTSAPDDQNYPVVATDAAGDYVVVWANYTDAIGATSTIEAQVFNASGTATTGIITVNSSLTPQLTTRSVPSVAMDANGDFVVAWELEPPQQPATGYYYDIQARRFTLSGTAVGNEFTVAGQTAYPNELVDPTVAMNNNSFVIGWQQGGTTTSSPVSIEAQRYSFSGTSTTPVGSNFAVTTAGRSFYPSVAMDTAGDFVFTWDDGYTGTNYPLLGQTYNASGVAQGSAISVATSTSPTKVPVAMNGAGDFAIVYYTGSNTNPSVHAHQYALTGTESNLSSTSLSSDVTVLNEGNSTYQEFPSVGIDAQGFATIAVDDFTGATNTSEGDVIDALRINPDGMIIETTPIQVAAQNTTQALLYPRVAISPAGKEAFAWEVVNKNAMPGQTDQVAERLFNYVNDAPTISTPANQKIAENGSTTVPLSGITAGTTINGGVEAQTLMVTASSSNTALIVPTVTYTSPGSTGTLNLNPVAGQFGTATITVTVTDSGGTANGGSNSKSVQFTLTVVGNPTANNQSVTVPFNTAKAITLTGSDPNSPPLSLTFLKTSNPSHGTLTGTAPNLTYTPTAGYQGTDSFTFTDSNGTATSSTATVSITVTPGTPTTGAQTVSVPHDSTGTPITLTGSDPDVPALPLTYSFAQPSHGTVVVSGAAGSPTVTYTPAAGYHGADTFTFTASNGTNTSSPATVTLNVAVGTPTAIAQVFAVPHDSTGTPITLTSTDDDTPALTITYSIATNPAHGTLSNFNASTGAVTYTPTAGYHGSDSFTFKASNGTNASPAATVTLNVGVGTPTANAQAASTTQGTAVAIALTGSDDDSPALPLTYAIVPGQGPANGTISNFNPSTGALTYTPNAGYSGPDGFEFTVSNGTNTSAPAVVTVNTTAPAQATVSGTVGVTWGTSGTATLQTNADGLRLLPQGRNTDLPWLGIDTISITLSQAEALSAGDVSVTGINLANYGPVTISGSGTSYTIALARPIGAADRVTVTVANAGIATFTRRLDVLPGDFNDDGVVNIQDAIGVRDEYLFLDGASPTTFGDINGDGTVDLNDYTAVRRLIGTRLP